MGPNVKKLICYKVSRDMVPPTGGKPDLQKIIDGFNNLGPITRNASEWVQEAIRLVKDAPGSEYATQDDEQIAGVILQKIEEKKAKNAT